MSSKKSGVSVIGVLLCVLLSGTLCMGLVRNAAQKNDPSADKTDYVERTDLGKIIALTETHGTLNEEDIASLNQGAVLSFEGEIYQLFQKDEVLVYAFTDSDNFYTRKYINVNPTDGIYQQWVEQTTYATPDDLGKIVAVNETNGTLSEEEFSSLGRGAVLSYNDRVYQLLQKNDSTWIYTNGCDVTSLTADYITIDVFAKTYRTWGKTVSTTPMVSGQTKLGVGETLDFQEHTMYVVQCFDADWTAAKMNIVGGTKANTECKFALVFVGGRDASYCDSLMVYQTGSSLNITNLAGTAGQATGLTPTDENCFLTYYTVGGNGLEK